MSSSTNTLARTAGLILYLLGAATAFALLALTVWGDFEANSFDAALLTEEQLRTLDCPVFITQDETAEITARIENPTDREVMPRVRARYTLGFVTLVDEKLEQLTIPPGGTGELSFQISAENAAYRRLILARVYQFQNLSLPSRQASCGVVLLPISGPTGDQAYLAMFIGSLALMATGLLLQNPFDRRLGLMVDNEGRRRRSMLRSYAFLGVYFLAGALVALIGNWLVGAILVIFAVVSIIGVFSAVLIAR
jgi:hypothetical protein